MPKFLSSRERQLKIGISSYTDTSTVLEVTGRVGIGTTYAQADLDIHGDVIVTGVLTATNLSVSENISINGDILSSGDIFSQRYYGDGQFLDNIVSNRLVVAADDQARYIGFVTATLGIVTAFSVSDSFVFIPSTQNVGLGTTNPTSKFTVIGDGSFSGTVLTKDFSATGISTLATLGVTGLTTTKDLQVTGIATISELDITGSLGIGTTNPTSKLTVVGDINATGVVTATAFYGDGAFLDNVISSRLVISADDQARYIGFLTSITGIVTSFSASESLVYIPSSGNLGLGTTNPTSKFTVAGDGSFTGTVLTKDFNATGISTLATLGVTGLTTTKDLIVTGIATIATLGVTGLTTTKNLNVTGIATIAELGVTGSLGIGTTNPTSKLTVVGDVKTTGVITATAFYGDGAFLDNVVSSRLVISADDKARYIGFLTATTGIVTSFSASESLVYIPSSGNLGLGTTNPTLKFTVAGDIKTTGFITATELYGDQVIGTPTGGFLRGAVGIDTSDYTKDSVNEINFILGKLVPKQPTTINNAAFTLTGLTGIGNLCSGFTPINNTSGDLTPTAGTTYSRNTPNTVSSNFITEYGPGDSGTVTGFINSVGVGTVTLTTGSNNGTFGSLEIANDKDASFSSRNTGIASEFYEVYDARLINAPSPDGFNKAFIRQLVAETQKAFWYEDPSTVTSPVLTSTTPVTPPSPVFSYSSGVPHYTESASNAFRYVITCQNATGDMYSALTFLLSSGTTSGFENGGDKSYTNFAGGTNPPARNFGVGVGVTCLVSQTPRNLHTTVSTDATKFSLYTANTPYGTGTVRATITQAVNIMGTTATTNAIDENNILITTLGTGSGNATRVNAGATGDNPTPVFTSWNASATAATYESIVRGAVLRHDQTNYSTGYLPVGPDYSSGRTGGQYFQLEIIRSQVSDFRISVTGSYTGCWVCMPSNSTWTTSLSGTNGWADMFQAYRGAGVPTSAQPGCSSGGAMTGSTGTFTCVFGTESSSNDSNNRILIRWRLNSGQSITAMSFSNT